MTPTDAPLTDEQVAAIKARRAAATPGAWEWDRRDERSEEWGHKGPDLVTVAGRSEPCPYYCVWRDTNGVEHRGQGPDNPHEHFYRDTTIISSWGHDADGISIEDADAEFIANAPTDIDALLAEVERLREGVARAAHLYRSQGKAAAHMIGVLLLTLEEGGSLTPPLR